MKSTEYQPKTGQRCHCRPGRERDNCPDCEGTGQRIDFAAIRARPLAPIMESEDEIAALRARLKGFGDFALSTAKQDADELAALRSDLAAAISEREGLRGALGMALQGLEKLAFITGHESDRLNARQARAALKG